VWPRNKSFQGFKPLKIVFGDPIIPPPESEASEAAYERLTAELKARVVEMWENCKHICSARRHAGCPEGILPSDVEQDAHA